MTYQVISSCLFLDVILICVTDERKIAEGLNTSDREICVIEFTKEPGKLLGKNQCDVVAL